MHPKVIRALSTLALAAATSVATPVHASPPHNFDVDGFLASLKAKILAWQNEHGRTGNHGSGTVPEPGTLALMGAGLGFAAWAAARRRKGQPPQA